MAPRNDALSAVMRVADKLEGSARNAYLKAVQGAINGKAKRELVKHLRSINGPVPDARAYELADQVNIDMARIEALSEKAIEAGRKHASGGQLGGEAPQQVQRAVYNSKQRINGIKVESRDAIRQLLGDAVRDGVHPREVAEQLEKHIGLDKRSSRSLSRMRQGLTEAGRTPKQIEKIINAQSKKLLAARAQKIARTEMMRGVNEGMEDYWIERMPTGSKRWRVAASDACAVCRGMNGEEVLLNSAFRVEGPPSHPNCRCTIEFVVPKSIRDQLFKGDRVGHPFRGNQWTGGRGGLMMAPDRGAGSGGGTANAPAAGGRPVKPGMKRATAEERKAQRIPPAWTDVHVSRRPEGVNGLVASGVDSKGRIQSRYSAKHTANAAAQKFDRINRLTPQLPKLDRALKRDALRSDEAGALTLIRRLGMRPGSTANTRAEKEAFGATTLQRRHVKVNPGSVTLAFTGKKGVNIRLTTRDPEVRRVIVDRLKSTEGQGPRARLFSTSAVKTQAYMREHTPGDYKLKDLRTVRANTVALSEVDKWEPPSTKRELASYKRDVGVTVSQQLGNTPSEALKSYINPAVFAPWEAAVE